MFKNVMWKLRKRTVCASVSLGMQEMGSRVEKTQILVSFIQKRELKLSIVQIEKYLYEFGIKGLINIKSPC